MTIDECRTVLAKLTPGISKDKTKRDAINKAIDGARANNVSFYTAHITVLRDYHHGYVVRID